MQAVRSHLGNDITHALIGLHAITRCDSVSGFYIKGKVKSAKLLFKGAGYQQTLGSLGMQHEVSEQLYDKLQAFVCHLYDQQSSDDVNEARFNLFRLGKHSEELLPKTKDSLEKHILRTNYQAAVWRRSLYQAQNLPGPVGNGWKLSDDGTLEVHWGDLPCAPENVLKTVQCACKTGGCGSKSTERGRNSVCGCVKDNLPCTTMCKFQGCFNSQAEEMLEDENEDSDSDEDKDEN